MKLANGKPHRPDKRDNALQREIEVPDLNLPYAATPRFQGPYILKRRPNSRSYRV
jgi:hypothetical protein